MKEDPLALIPEICLAGGAVLGLALGVFLPRRRQWLVRALALAACLGGLASTAVAMAGEARTVYGGSYAVDAGLNGARLVVLGGTVLVLVLSIDSVRGHAREAEFCALVLLAALGTVVLAGASDLMLLFAGYLLASVPLYALAGFFKDAAGAEASMKYYLMGALLGVTMLGGVTVLFGAAGATAYGEVAAAGTAGQRGAVAVGLVAVLAGLLFKVGGVPAHFWVPDVAQGASAPVAALVTTIPKVGGLVALFRLLEQALPGSAVDWPLLVALLAAASMTLGNLAAFFQDSPRRLLAYSTVSQVGYMLMAVAVATRSDLALQALLVYLAAYAATNLGAFAVVAELPNARRLGDYAGLARRRPWLALTLVVCLLGLVGTPPTGIFVGKLEVFTAAIDGGLLWLAVLAVANTVASVFYYLRWIAPAVLRRPEEGPAGALAPAGRWSAAGAYAAGAASLLLGLAAGWALNIADAGLAR